jgi:hypothetical protein
VSEVFAGRYVVNSEVSSYTRRFQVRRKALVVLVWTRSDEKKPSRKDKLNCVGKQDLQAERAPPGVAPSWWGNCARSSRKLTVAAASSALNRSNQGSAIVFHHKEHVPVLFVVQLAYVDWRWQLASCIFSSRQPLLAIARRRPSISHRKKIQTIFARTKVIYVFETPSVRNSEKFPKTTSAVTVFWLCRSGKA